MSVCPDLLLPSTGSSRVEFPRFLGTTKRLRILATHPAALRFLRLAVPSCATYSLPLTRSAAPLGLDKIAGCPSGFWMEVTRSPKSPWNPFVRMPRSPTPARRPRRPYSASVLPSVNATTSALSKHIISRLNHAAYVPTVYASQAESPRTHARLAFDWWPAFVEQDWLPARFLQGGFTCFGPIFLHVPPPYELAWRNAESIHCRTGFCGQRSRPEITET